MTWIEFWKLLLIFSLAAYAVLAVVVTWRGAGDARSMLAAMIRRDSESSE